MVNQSCSIGIVLGVVAHGINVEDYAFSMSEKFKHSAGEIARSAGVGFLWVTCEIPPKTRIEAPIGILLRGPYLDSNGRVLGCLRKVGRLFNQRAILIQREAHANWELLSVNRDAINSCDIGVFEISKIESLVSILLSQSDPQDQSYPHEGFNFKLETISHVELHYEPSWMEKWRSARQRSSSRRSINRQM